MLLLVQRAANVLSVQKEILLMILLRCCQYLENVTYLKITQQEVLSKIPTKKLGTIDVLQLSV